jgi:hypothetical protein
MLSLAGTLATLCLAGDVLAQTSTYFSPGVPTDAPIAGGLSSMWWLASWQETDNLRELYRPVSTESSLQSTTGKGPSYEDSIYVICIVDIGLLRTS